MKSITSSPLSVFALTRTSAYCLSTAPVKSAPSILNGIPSSSFVTCNSSISIFAALKFPRRSAFLAATPSLGLVGSIALTILIFPSLTRLAENAADRPRTGTARHSESSPSPYPPELVTPRAPSDLRFVLSTTGAVWLCRGLRGGRSMPCRGSSYAIRSSSRQGRARRAGTRATSGTRK